MGYFPQIEIIISYIAMSDSSKHKLKVQYNMLHTI